jgi:methyl-accepting chemotaxis protein
VVAGEVKQLATQTARSTEDIARHINQVKVATGESMASVARIERTINEVNAIAGSIAAAVEQQGAATGEIARNVSETASAANEMTERTAEVLLEAEDTGGQAGEVYQDSIGLDAAVETWKRAVIRVVRTSTEEVDRRLVQRFDVDLPCRISIPGQPVLSGRLAHLSHEGAAIRDVPKLSVGTRGTLGLDTVTMPLPFTVSGTAAGLLRVALALDAAVAAKFDGVPERLALRRAA